MKAATVALVLASPLGTAKVPQILEVLSDEQEIAILEEARNSPSLDAVHQFRLSRTREEEDFADYVEQLLSQPFLRPEIQDHGVQWLRSRIRIQEFQRHEAEAAQIIAEYALKVFLADRANIDFMLAGPRASVRVKVFVVAVSVSLPAAG